jgi:hypothetical protein
LCITGLKKHGRKYTHNAEGRVVQQLSLSFPVAGKKDDRGGEGGILYKMEEKDYRGPQQKNYELPSSIF